MFISAHSFFALVFTKNYLTKFAFMNYVLFCFLFLFVCLFFVVVVVVFFVVVVVFLPSGPG